MRYTSQEDADNMTKELFGGVKKTLEQMHPLDEARAYRTIGELATRAAEIADARNERKGVPDRD